MDKLKLHAILRDVKYNIITIHEGVEKILNEAPNRALIVNENEDDKKHCHNKETPFQRAVRLGFPPPQHI